MSFQVKYIYDLVDKISPQLEKIKANVSGLSAKITATSAVSGSSFMNLQTKIQAASVKIGASINNISNNIGKMGAKARTLGKDLFLKTTLPIGLLGAKFIKSASDYQESINKVDVAFGDTSKSVKEFASVAGKNFGIDRGSALDMAAMFGDMATGMGLSQEKAGGLATSLVGLAGDVASFKNIGIDQAQTALAGIFTGETESLKRLGVVMTETNLEQYALRRGFQGSMKDLDQASKVVLRHQFVMDMLKNSQGDFLRTQEGFANQTRILGSRFKDLSITLGTILLPYAIKLINVAISLVEKFQGLSEGTQKWILIIAGITAAAAPILMILGMMAGGIAILTKGVILAAVAFRGLGTAMLFASKNPLILGITALVTGVALVAAYWDDIIGKAKEFINIIAKTKIGHMLGIEGNLSTQAALPQTNQVQNINQRQSLDASGTVKVEVGGNAPSGTRASFIPSRNSIYDTGIMGAFAQ